MYNSNFQMVLPFFTDRFVTTPKLRPSVSGDRREMGRKYTIIVAGNIHPTSRLSFKGLAARAILVKENVMVVIPGPANTPMRRRELPEYAFFISGARLK